MKKAFLVVVCLLMVVLPVCAFASSATSIQYINLQASSSLGTASFSIPVSGGDLSSIGATVLTDASGSKIGTVSWTALVTDDYSSFLNFTAISGAADTTFTVDSGITFSPLASAQIDGSSSITLTGGKKNGATLTGNGDAGYAFFAGVNGSTIQSLLETPISVGAHSSLTESGDLNSVVFNNVSSLNSKYVFKVSAGSSASGTSTLGATAVPEPGTLVALCSGLVGMAGMVGITRRRKEQ